MLVITMYIINIEKKYGQLQQCETKSDFLVYLCERAEVLFGLPDIVAKLFDGAPFFKKNFHSQSKANGDYCGVELAQRM